MTQILSCALGLAREVEQIMPPPHGLAMPRHLDGGRGLIFLAISLWSNRTVRIWQQDGTTIDMPKLDRIAGTPPAYTTGNLRTMYLLRPQVPLLWRHHPFKEGMMTPEKSRTAFGNGALSVMELLRKDTIASLKKFSNRRS